MTEEIPESVKNLNDEQKKYLKEVAKLFDNEFDADSLQIDLYELSKEKGIKAGDAFSAIYMTFIGKTHGPRAGVLLSNIGKDKVLKRLKEVSNL
jgi:lysyl-tRNA synthetase class I